MEKKFIHLQVHTEFSISDGLLSIPSLMSKAAAFNMPALAITDLNNLYAAIKFYQAALQFGLKPILGADLTLLDSPKSKTKYQTTFLCQNEEGYRNLLKLISKSYLEGQKYGSPIIQKNWLKSHAGGLIVLSRGLEGDIGKAIIAKESALVNKYLDFWRTHFPERFYLEINRIGKIDEIEYINTVTRLAHEFSLPMVATNAVRFLEADDFEAHEARVCIQQGVTLEDPHREKPYTEQQYLRSTDEMQQLFADMPETLENSIEIAKRCNVILELGKNRLPHFQVPASYTTESYLDQVAKTGLEARLQTRFKNLSPDSPERSAYDERLRLELNVINKMGFAGYFLIVADFTKWAKENGIPVGPGRGSGPGSLVAFSLNITDLDPLALELLFERFLNPERISMPDFDIDFCMEGRDKVIEYVMHKHGQDSVAQIITYGTMAAKAVVRDVGRVLGFPYGFVDKIAKLIPFELGMTLRKALEQEPLLKERYEQEEEVRNLIDLALKLEGITRNVGKHAGGIVIAPGKLTDFVPLYCESHDSPYAVTQFDKDDVEAVGLVKFDFLGLKTLTIIDRALRIINEDRQDKIDISLIPLNDVETFKLLKACKSTAVFQLESPGMRDLIKRLQPDCFEDLTALVALFRPGPLQSGMVDDFINRKHGRAKVLYPHPRLEPVLRPTYGVILYQEQVMQIAQVLAGYTLGAADILRRAMGKKKPEEMAKQREIFCTGAISQGVDATLANHIFDLMEKFAGYGFNKSHSASYALIAYQTAWLKAHYPAAFMAAVLSSDMDRTEKIIILLNECKLLDLQVSPPDINKGEYFFKELDKKHLIYGLGAVKGIGEAAIENIITARKLNGPFESLFDFCKRVDLRKVNRRVLEVLIKSGCFDSFNVHRASLMATLNHALLHAEQSLQNQLFGQHDLLSTEDTSHSLTYVAAAKWDDEIQLQNEKDTLGFYLSGHPFNRYQNELQHFITCPNREINPASHPHARIAGIISNLRIRQTKRGDRIGIFSLDDGTSHIDVVCFSEVFNKFRPLLNEDQLIIVEGDVSIDTFNNSARIVSKEIYSMDEARARFAKYLEINVDEITKLDAKELKLVLTQYLGGNCTVVIRYLKDNSLAHIRLGEDWCIKPSQQILTAIQNTFQIKQIGFVYK